MARRNRNRQAVAAPAQTADSYQNFAARVGLGAQNQNSASQYGFSPVSRNRVELEFAYRSSWLCGMAVDVVAQDMTREGVEFTGSLQPDQIEKLEKASTRMQLWRGVTDTIRWARLYGGAVGVLMIDGQKLETPLRLETIRQGQFKGLMVLDRWMVQPSFEDLVQEFGPEMGKPAFYTVVQDTMGLQAMKIHHSRVIRLEGQDLPYWQRIAENGWGMSVLERLWDRLIPYDSVTAGAAQLVYKAHLRTYKVDGLREIIAVGGKALAGLTAQIDMIRKFQSNEGLTLMDAKDEFETHSYSFSGLSDMMLQFGQQISGALGIPLVRLFGQSPAGLSSTGESDIRLYYDNIKAQQEATLRPGLLKVFGALYRSELGHEPDEDFDFEFTPLWQLSTTEKATVAQTTATAVVGAYESGLIGRATALSELRQSSHATGVFSNVSDEDIEEARNELPPDPNESVGEAAKQETEKANSNESADA